MTEPSLPASPSARPASHRSMLAEALAILMDVLDGASSGRPMRQSHVPPGSVRFPSPASPLSPRGHEVAALIALQDLAHAEAG